MLHLSFSTPLGLEWLFNKCWHIRQTAYQLCMLLFTKVEKLHFCKSNKINFMVVSPQDEGL